MRIFLPFASQLKATKWCLYGSIIVLSGLLLGCVSAPSKQQFDLGLLPAPAQSVAITHTLSLMEMEVPTSLEGQAMLYRLAYDHPQALFAYTQSSWSATPAQLISHRLKWLSTAHGVHLASPQDGLKDLPQLRLELIDFSQVFSQATHSEVHFVLRASLIHQRKLMAQQHFSIKEMAGADAASGARAMTQANDKALMLLIRWIKDQKISGMP